MRTDERNSYMQKPSEYCREKVSGPNKNSEMATIWFDTKNYRNFKLKYNSDFCEGQNKQNLKRHS